MNELPGHGATVDVLATEAVAPERRARWSVVVAVTAAVAVVLGGVAYGVGTLSGGGAQPEDALPSGVVAFTAVDLDPPAGQKVDGFRFLRKFPSLRDRLVGDDLRKVIFDGVAGNAGWQDVDFGSDVAPWLGARVGLGVYPASTFTPDGGSDATQAGPVMVVALQVTDQDAARRGLDRLLGSVTGAEGTTGVAKPGYVLAGDYALLATSTPVAQAAADLAAEGSLAESPTFVADTADLGDGFASAWFDGRAAADLLPAASALGLSRLGLGGLDTSALDTSLHKSMHTAYVLRFDGPDVVELAGRVTGVPTVPGGDVRLSGLGDLPAGSAVAVGLGGGDALVDPLWAAVRQQAAGTAGTSAGGTSAGGRSADDLIAAAERASGLDLPADLKLLLGSNLLATLDRAGVRSGEPDLGVRVVTSDPARADTLLDRATAASGVPPMVHHATDDGYVLASTEAHAVRLTDQATGDRLGEVPAFRRALPDVDTARFAAWVDLREVLAAIAGTGDGGLPKDLRPLQGVGATATSEGAGAGSFRLRLLTH